MVNCSGLQIQKIIAFNNESTVIWPSATSSQPPENADVVLLVDISESMIEKQSTLLNVLGSVLSGSTVDTQLGDFKLPPLMYRTALIAAVKKVVDDGHKGRVMIISDGGENIEEGYFPMMNNGVLVESPYVDFRKTYGEHEKDKSDKRNEVLVGFLEQLGVEMIIVGIGDEVIPMLNAMQDSKKVFYTHLRDDADVDAMEEAVKMVKSVARGNKVKNIVLQLDDKKRKRNVVGKEQAQKIRKLVGKLSIEGTEESEDKIVEDKRTVDDLKNGIDDAFAFVFKGNFGALKVVEKDIKTRFLVMMGFMCEDSAPAAMICSKTNPIIPIPKAWKDASYALFINSVCSHLSNKDNFFKCEKKSSDIGYKTGYAGKQFTYKQCALYSTSYKIDLVTKLAADTTFCKPLAEVLSAYNMSI